MVKTKASQVINVHGQLHCIHYKSFADERRTYVWNVSNRISSIEKNA